MRKLSATDIARLSGLVPGLPALWRQGAWSGLFVAVVFTTLLNAALLTTWVWDELVSSLARGFMWLATATLWGIGAWTAVRARGEGVKEGQVPPLSDLFPTAQREYLRGNWYECETQCRALLEADPRDAEARLLLLGVLRRSRRWDEARRELASLSALETAEHWSTELAAELQRINRSEGNEPADDPAILAAIGPGQNKSANKLRDAA